MEKMKERRGKCCGLEGDDRVKEVKSDAEGIGRCRGE